LLLPYAVAAEMNCLFFFTSGLAWKGRDLGKIVLVDRIHISKTINKNKLKASVER